MCCRSGEPVAVAVAHGKDEIGFTIISRNLGLKSNGYVGPPSPAC